MSARGLGVAASTQGVMDYAMRLHAIYHKRKNFPVKMTLEEIEGENAKHNISRYCLWCAKTIIPKKNQ
jgi:hypothetical protein